MTRGASHFPITSAEQVLATQIRPLVPLSLMIWVKLASICLTIKLHNSRVDSMIGDLVSFPGRVLIPCIPFFISYIFARLTAILSFMNTGFAWDNTKLPTTSGAFQIDRRFSLGLVGTSDRAIFAVYPCEAVSSLARMIVKYPATNETCFSQYPHTS